MNKTTTLIAIILLIIICSMYNYSGYMSNRDKISELVEIIGIQNKNISGLTKINKSQNESVIILTNIVSNLQNNIH